MLILVVLSFLGCLVSVCLCVFAFLVGATSRGAPVDPRWFKIMPRAGIAAIAFFWLTIILVAVWASTTS